MYQPLNADARSTAGQDEGLIPQTEAIRLYCGIGEDDWCGMPLEVGAFACISPVYGRTLRTKSVNYVEVPPSVKAVIQDSGAFCDGPDQRLTFEEALKRQIEHAERFRYAERVAYRASYDQLIDEKWREGVRHKQRWTENEAWDACVTTIKAAKYLSDHRYGIPCILSAQGVTASQYLACTQGILPYFQPGDVLGLGGWCITGKIPRQVLPAFREMLHLVLPFVGQEGITRIHIWGCLYAPALGELLYLCDQYGIALSTDSVGPSLRPVYGKWGYSSWTDSTYRFRRPPPGPELAADRRLHVSLVRDWLERFRENERRHYRWRPIIRQWHFFEHPPEGSSHNTSEDPSLL
jgi:hypothetical protein